MNFVAECNLSFNITQNDTFRELITLTAGREVKIPTTKEIMDTLRETSEITKSTLIERIAQQKYVCTTCDIWSSRSQSYFCMTIHFINPKFQRESYVLGFRQMKHKQTNKELNELIRQMFREHKIDSNKVKLIVKDKYIHKC